MKTLLIDTVEAPPDQPETQVLAEWFGPVLATLPDIQRMRSFLPAPPGMRIPWSLPSSSFVAPCVPWPEETPP
jgi:hypothetical protein